MTKLSKRELLEVGRVLILANTPLTLLKGLRSSSAMRKLRYEWSPDELLHYYDFLTARPKQSEVSVALSYALLISILLRGQAAVDPSRLRWGEFLREYLARSSANTQYLEVTAPAVTPTIQTANTTSHTILYGPDDQPIDLAERLRI